ncbi:MAG: AzlD domain-containing protein [Clostridia bacterium]|nr:AzlD domain-containing protein [Clostridia bacterium]
MNIYIYIACMAGVTFLIRVLPLTLIRKEIQNRTLRSFLYYVPYVTLAVMTFPAMLYVTQSQIAAAVALVVAILLAWFRKGLFTVAVASCLTVLLLELFL